jgi:hypothetical protein
MREASTAASSSAEGIQQCHAATNSPGGCTATAGTVFVWTGLPSCVLVCMGQCSSSGLGGLFTTRVVCVLECSSSRLGGLVASGVRSCKPSAANDAEWSVIGFVVSWRGS